MKKIVLHFTFLLALGGSLHAQEFDYGWHTVEDTDETTLRDMQIYNNQIYTLYTYRPNGDFDANPGSGADMLSDNTFLNDVLVYMTVTDMNGNHLSAFRLLEGPFIDEWSAEFTIGADGEIIVYGYSDPQTNFDPEGAGQGVYSSTNILAFVSMYQNNGAYITHWEYPYSLGTSEITIRDVVVSGDLLYVIGGFFGDIDFDMTANDDIHTALATDAFISRINLTSQTYNWTKTFGSDQGEAAYLGRVHNNKLYVNGKYSSDSLDIDPGAGEVYLSNQIGFNTDNQFLGIFDLDGNYLNSLKIDGNASIALGGFCLDAADNVYLFGSNAQFDFIDFDPSPDVSWIYSSDNEGNFVVKYNANMELEWQTSIFSDDQSTFTSYAGLRNQIETNGDYVAILLGNFTGNLFQAVNFVTPTALPVSGANSDLLVMALDAATGAMDTVSVYAGDDVMGNTIAMTSNDDLIIQGSFYGSMDLNIYDGVANPETYSAQRGFTLKLNWFDFTGLNEMENSELSVFPNPATDRLEVHSSTALNVIRLMDLNGKIIFEQPAFQAQTSVLDLTQIQAGYYLVQVESTAGASQLRQFNKQ